MNMRDDESGERASVSTSRRLRVARLSSICTALGSVTEVVIIRATEPLASGERRVAAETRRSNRAATNVGCKNLCRASNSKATNETPRCNPNSFPSDEINLPRTREFHVRRRIGFSSPLRTAPRALPNVGFAPVLGHATRSPAARRGKATILC